MKLMTLILTALALCAPQVGFSAPSSTDYFPAKGSLLVHIDVQRIQKSQVFKDVMGFAMMNPSTKKNLDEFKTRFGIDPFKDVTQVSLHLDEPPVGSQNAEGFAYIQGNFKESLVLAGLKKEGEATEEMIGTQKVYLNKDGQGAIAFVPGGILMGNPASLKAGVAQKGTFGGPLKTLQQSYSHGKNDLWLGLVVTPKMAADLALKNPMMGGFTQTMISVDMAQGLHLAIEAMNKSAEGASAVAKMLNTQIKAASASPQMMMFAGMVSKLKIAAQKTAVVIDLPLNDQDVAQIKMMAGMMMAGLQQGAKGPSFPSKVPVPAPAPAPAPAPSK